MFTNERRFRCDLKKPDGSPDCNVDFYYEDSKPPAMPGMPPQTPIFEPGIQAALTKIVAITYSFTGYATGYCCEEHAIEAIKRGQHMPPIPSKITGATEADMNRAKGGMKVVDGMRAGAKPS